MSLISQNISSKNRVKRANVDTDEPAFLGVNKDDEEGRESGLVISKTKKKRKERDELLEKQLEIEEGKEMKKLENVLFGSQYAARLRAHHAKMNPGTDWARPDSQSRSDGLYDDGLSDEENGIVLARGYKNDDAFDDILRTNEDLVVKSIAKLLRGLLEYSRLVDANVEDPSNGPINSV